jgi:hypothetical protein
MQRSRLAWFKRQAKVIVSLNHSHIAQICGVEGQEPIALEAYRATGTLNWCNFDGHR